MKQRSKELLILLYKMRFEQGMKQVEIVKKTGYSSAEVSLCFSTLRGHLRGEISPTVRNLSYREACKFIKKNYDIPSKWLTDKKPKVKKNVSTDVKSVKQAEVKELPRTPDEFNTLEQSFDIFTENIQNFINIRVKKEVGKNDKKLRNLELQLKKSRKIINDLEVENIELRKIKDEAKSGNWINSLRKNWS